MTDDFDATDFDPTDDHERLRADLGGYVLGGLTLVEQQAVEAHLATCAACRGELADLDAIPVLLDLAHADAEVDTSPPGEDRPSPAVGGLGTETAAVTSIDTAPSSGRRPSGGERKGRNRALLAAVGAVAVAAALIIGVLIGSPSEPEFGPTIPLQAVAAAPAGAGPADAPSGTAALRSTDNGTVVRLEIQGLPDDGSWYECTWSAYQGNLSAGTFRPGPDGTVSIDLTTAAREYPGWKLTIVEHNPETPEGEPVLEATA